MPVYDYEAILEVRRREKEERKRVREERKREKERRKMERAKRRADKILGRKLLLQRNDAEQKKLDHHLKKKQPMEEITVSDVLASLEDEKSESTKEEEEEEKEETNVAIAIAPVEKSATEGEEEEEVEEEDEHEDDEDEDGDEEEEEEEEEEDEDKQSSRLAQSDDVATAAESEEAVQPEVDAREWPSLPPAPLKGILVCPGFG